MSKNDKLSITPIVRTSSGLRDAIFDELDAIRNGSSNPTKANAVAKLAMGIVETVRMEVEVQQHLRRFSDIKDVGKSTLGAPMLLGSRA